jgi:hypothetical protein
MQMYGHSDLDKDKYTSDLVGEKAAELGRSRKCFYFSTNNNPNIKIFKINRRMKVPNPRMNGNNYIGYNEEIKFGYGYFTKYGGDAGIHGINVDFSSIVWNTPRENGLLYTDYRVHVKESNQVTEVESDRNKCFIHIIPPADGVFPIQPLEELSEEERAKLLLLGYEPASPIPPPGSTRNNPPPFNLNAAAAGSANAGLAAAGSAAAGSANAGLANAGSAAAGSAAAGSANAGSANATSTNSNEENNYNPQTQLNASATWMYTKKQPAAKRKYRHRNTRKRSTRRRR